MELDLRNHAPDKLLKKVLRKRDLIAAEDTSEQSLDPRS